MACRFAYLFERFPAFTQTFCAREIVALYEQDIRPTVYSIRRPAEAKPENVSLDEVPVVYLPDTNSLRFKLETKLAAPRMRSLWDGQGDKREKNRFYEALFLGKRLRQAGIEHVHVHFAGLGSRTAWWLNRLFGITYSFTGHAKDIFVPNPDHRTTLEELIRSAKFVVAVSDHGAEYLRRLVPEAAARIVRIYNGLNVQVFKPSNPPLRPVQILSIGRLIEKKGFPILIEACRLLRDQGVPFKCSIIGSGPEQTELEGLVKFLELSDQVQLLGPKPQPDIVQALSEAQLFVFPAMRDQKGDADNLPTVLIEAMASGLPLVSTNVAGIPEIVHHGENGLVVEEKDPGGLANAVRLLIENPELSVRYGNRSREIAKSTFQIDQTARALSELLRPWWEVSR